MKIVKTTVNAKLLELGFEFAKNPFAEYKVKVQNGVPVNARKVKDFRKPKRE
ncbi:MAG: hypothetical protein H8E18_04510 [FCB group bacterium]|nr:hypothetical protein [FCB group bacterium]